MLTEVTGRLQAARGSTSPPIALFDNRTGGTLLCVS